MILDVIMETQPQVIDFGFEIGTMIGDDLREHYEGPYEVTPMVSEQTLETDEKVMDENVVVFAIPYSEVSNPSGGKTATIG